MNKYLLIFIPILLSSAGFTQTDNNPCFSALETYISYNLTGDYSQNPPYGLQYYTFFTGNDVSWQSPSGDYQFILGQGHAENTVLISRDFVSCLQSLICNCALLPDDYADFYITVSKLCLEHLHALPNPSQLNSNSQSMYGIKNRLLKNEDSPSSNLMHYDKPAFDVSTLHKDEVIKELIKQLRLQEFDFSGVIQEFYKPSIPPDFH
jgi:hypothetical protein